MTLNTFLKDNRAALDSCIRRYAPYVALDDAERKVWVRNDEALHNWAKAAGVKVAIALLALVFAAPAFGGMLGNSNPDTPYLQQIDPYPNAWQRAENAHLQNEQSAVHSELSDLSRSMRGAQERARQEESDNIQQRWLWEQQERCKQAVCQGYRPYVPYPY